MTRLYADMLSRVTVFITVALFLGGCVAPNPQVTQVTAPTPQIIIQADIPGREVVQPIELDNCDGKADTKRTEHRTRSVESTISAEIAAKFGVSAEVLSAEVQATVGASAGWTEGQGTSIELVAPPGTRMAFQLVWIGNEQVGVVQNLRGSNIPIAFRIFKPTDVRIKSQYDIGCPPLAARVPTAAPLQPTVPPVAPTRTKIAQPAVVNRGELLFQDFFDSPSGWNVEPGIQITDGKLIVFPGNDAVPKGSIAYADFVFESRFHIPAHGAMAFYLRNQLPSCNNGSWNCSIQIVLDFKSPNQVFVARRSRGSDVPIDIHRGFGTALRVNDWNQFIALATGSNYKVYVNDVLVLDFVDSEYVSGSFIIDNDPKSSGEIELDYIRIYKVQ